MTLATVTKQRLGSFIVCEKRCPFGVPTVARIAEAAAFFN